MTLVLAGPAFTPVADESEQTTREEYRYENIDDNEKGLLYVCQGQIAYHSRGNYTMYHGEFNMDPGNWPVEVEIKFNRRGDESNLTSAVLLHRSPRCWSGWDENEKWVCLTHIGTSSFSPTTGMWGCFQDHRNLTIIPVEPVMALSFKPDQRSR